MGNAGYRPPCNGGTGREYNGINKLILAFKSMEQGWSDNRFYTFNQVGKMDGCKVEAGSKATRVEYWAVFDSKEKKTLTLSQCRKLMQDDPSRKESEFRLFSKAAYVFNAAQIEGLEPLPPVGEKAWDGATLAEEVVKTMSENMEVELHYGGDQAYYRPDIQQ